MEGIRQFSSELVSLDLQHEREIHDIQKRIQNLEIKARKSPLLASSQSSSYDVKSSKYHVSVDTKDSAFASGQPSRSTGLGNCELCTSVNSEKNMRAENEVVESSSPSYHLKFSKINMAMKKLKDDLRVGELKKRSSLSL